MVIATIQVKARCICKALHFPSYIINVWKWVRAAKDGLIQLAEIGQKLDAPILLVLEETGTAPWGAGTAF
eukprot:10363549-Ditylum_brightwellii.AAC.1